MLVLLVILALQTPAPESPRAPAMPSSTDVLWSIDVTPETTVNGDGDGDGGGGSGSGSDGGGDGGGHRQHFFGDDKGQGYQRSSGDGNCQDPHGNSKAITARLHKFTSA